MRDIEGPFLESVNYYEDLDYKEPVKKKEKQRTTHIRIFVESKEAIMAKARHEGMTVPRYIRKVLEEHNKGEREGAFM